VHATLDGRDASRVTQQINATVQRVDGENDVIDWNATRNDSALRRDGAAATGEARKGSNMSGTIAHAVIVLRSVA
jgi:hypothetical protein